MKRLLLFAGASEGRLLAEMLAGEPVEITACTATEYGRELLPTGPKCRVRAGRLTPAEMLALMEEEGFDWVVDATHPYAVQASANIRKAAGAAGLTYLRLLRKPAAWASGTKEDTAFGTQEALWLKDAEEAAKRLDKVPGRVLLTTGSKDLAVYTGLPDFARRFYLRVLPLEESIRHCRELGFLPGHILAMQGPFSQELNEALLRQWQIRIMITKESGSPGGFWEKAAAAAAAGVWLWILGRPAEEEGFTLTQMAEYLKERL